MHEMSIAASLLELAEAEAKKNGCDKIIRVRVQCGVLCGIMPDALRMAFQILTEDTIHNGALLELEQIPLKMRCPFCNAVFTGQSATDVWQDCPGCGESFGHVVLQGKELILTQLEAVKSADC